jgi:hypothetical protein
VQASSTFYEVQAASTKFGLHVGNMKFNTRNKNKYMYIDMENFHSEALIQFLFSAMLIHNKVQFT